jgi:hypothetical protein
MFRTGYLVFGETLDPRETMRLVFDAEEGGGSVTLRTTPGGNVVQSPIVEGRNSIEVMLHGAGPTPSTELHFEFSREGVFQFRRCGPE